MQTVSLKLYSDYYIWAPLALTGCDLLPEKNILLEVKKNRIVSCQMVQKDLLPSYIKVHPGFYPLEEGTTLLPALIDAHIHLALDGKNFIRARAMWKDSNALQTRIKHNLSEMINSGIGAVRDGGDSLAINLEAKRMVDSEQYSGPRIVAVGQAIRVKGGYGSFLGLDYECRTDIPALVERIWASGVDQIKVVISGVVSFIEYGSVKGLLMPLDDLCSVVAGARKYGLKVMAHASSAAAVDLALKAGVDSIEHGYFVSADGLKAMAEKHVAWIPTIIPVAAQLRGDLFAIRTPLETEVISTICKEQIEKLKCAFELGVPLGVGTDSGAGGVSHACNLVEEMLLYKTGFLDNRTVLKAATVTNAGILGLEKEIGILEPGYKAALIAVRGNPLDNLEDLKEVDTHFLPS